MPRQQHREAHPFVEYLETLVKRGDRGALAALRRGLGKLPGTAPEVFPYVVPWVPGNASRSREASYYFVASLFALWHQGRAGPQTAGGNLGWSFARLASQAGAAPQAVERRFVSLLRSRLEDLPEHLRHGVSLLRSHDVPVEWSQLLTDLWWWEDTEGGVQRRWAREFWQREPEEEEAEHVR